MSPDLLLFTPDSGEPGEQETPDRSSGIPVRSSCQVLFRSSWPGALQVIPSLVAGVLVSQGWLCKITVKPMKLNFVKTGGFETFNFSKKLAIYRNLMIF